MPKSSPAFQFYAQDFLVGTMTMSAAARGCYISMLSFSWVNGPIPNTTKALTLAMCWGDSDGPFKPLWGEIAPKWKLGADGWTNDRLEAVRAAQELYREEQSRRGKMGAIAKHGTAKAPPVAPLKRPLSSSSLTSSSSLSLASHSQDPAQSANATVDPKFVNWLRAALHAELDAYPDLQFSELAEIVKATAAKERTQLHPEDVTSVVEQVLQTRERRARA